MNTATRESNATAIPTFAEQEWDDGRFSIQHWLERTVEKRLQDTRYGMEKDVEPAHPALFEDPLVNMICKMDLATFLIAERHSVKSAAEMSILAPDETSRIFLASQVLDEARHYEIFCKRLADLGVTPAQRDKLINQYTTPPLKKFFDLLDEQLDKKNFDGAVIGHNLILEGMAYPIYRYETRYWSKFDPGLSQLINGAFRDEVHHNRYAEEYLKSRVRKDASARNQVLDLVRQFHLLMTDIFDNAVRHYIGLYQEAANGHMDVLGDIEIFPGKKMADMSEEDQTRRLQQEIQDEYKIRLRNLGLHEAL
jgi:1,2-phenylacetyl-CoA epoxidase catalytic subunit